MAVPPAPPPLEQAGPRPFSFYPPIGNIEHNEWLYQRASWSEVLVRNTKTAEEIWVPRRYVGEISSVDEPVMIVGLLKELEYRAGALWPVVRRVIQMPVAVNETPRPSVASREDRRPANVVGIRLENRAESRIGKLILAAIAAGMVACVLVVSFSRGSMLGHRMIYAPLMQADLDLTARDDYYGVLRLLGLPDDDRWKSETGEFQYRKLTYRKLGYSVILMGTDRKDAHYIGAMDKSWNPVHTVQLPNNVNSYSLLRQLKRF
ncbi:MAG TPA: hypothetical protein VKU01_18695 [Bryobacteraceae bacterium]|nr:hypothetical protein [Bryobacteraceae bacterium]